MSAEDASNSPMVEREAAARPGGLFAVIFCALIVLHIIIVNCVTILPFPDLGFHLAAATIVHDFDEPEAPYADYYVLDSGIRPNRLHLRVASSGLFGSAVTANNLLYSIYVATVPVLVLLIIRRLRGNAWAALLAFPFLYALTVAYGFVEFTGAIPFMLALLYAAIRWHESPRWPAALAVALLLVMIFTAHAIALIFSLMFIALFIALRWMGRWRGMLAASTALVPATGLLLIWYQSRGETTSSLGWLKGYYETRYFREFPARVLDWLRLDNRVLVSESIGPWIAVCFAAAIVALALYLVARRGHGFSFTPVTWIRRCRDNPLLAVHAFLLTVAFVLLLGPPGYPPFWWVYQRFTNFLMIGLVVLIAMGVRRRAEVRILAVVGVICAVAHGGFWLEHMHGFRAECRDFRAALPEQRDDSPLGIVMTDTGYRGEREATMHIVNYYTTLRGGVAVSALYDFPFSVVRQRDGSERLPRFDTVRTDDWEAYVPEIEIDLVLCRGEIDPASRFARQFRPIRAHGRWTLYERIADGPVG